MPSSPSRLAALLSLSFCAFAGCTFHATATRWHARTAPDGQPVFMTTTTTYGLNLGVVLPLVGDTRPPAVIDSCMEEIARTGSNRVRVVETENANYWYALPPISWIVSPVYGSVSVEYTPSELAVAEATEDMDYATQQALERRDVPPEPSLPPPEGEPRPQPEAKPEANQPPPR